MPIRDIQCAQTRGADLHIVVTAACPETPPGFCSLTDIMRVATSVLRGPKPTHHYGLESVRTWDDPPSEYAMPRPWNLE